MPFLFALKTTISEERTKINQKLEIRMNPSNLESKSDGSMVVSGYVNKTNQKSNTLGSTKKFIEKISTGAFSRALQNAKTDIDFLAEHDSKRILSSTRNKSLHLIENQEGLFMEATIVPTSWGKDTFSLIESGIYRNMSFGFKVISDSWRALENGLYERTIKELDLYEVSVVKNPAYSQSTIAARGIEIIENIEIPNNINISEEKNNMKTIEHRYGITPESMETEQRKFEFEEFKNYLQEHRGLSTTVEGQSAVPESVADVVVKKMTESSPVFAMAKKFPSSSGTLKIGRETNLFDAGFVGEGSEVLRGKIDLNEVKLEQKRVGAAVYLTNQLINDAAVNIVDYSTGLLGRKVVKAMEKSILTGNSEEEFKGIIHDPDIKSFNKVEGITSVTQDDLMDMYNSIHPDYHQGSSFIMNKEAFSHISKMKDGGGHYFLQNGVVNGKPTRTLFGAVVYVTDVLPSTNPVVFGNVGEGYAIMIKKYQGLQMVTDTSTALRGTKLLLLDVYADGVVYNPQALVKMSTV
jgi:HK97 family phage major capsid protein/HK97 family phage prohead protease